MPELPEVETVKKVVEEFEDFGYYIDERGYRRWGVIPKDNK